MPRVISLVAFVAVVLGCAPSPPPSPPRAPARPHPADRFAAARHLPGSAAAFLATPSLAGFLEATHYEAFRAAFAAALEEAAFEVTEETGLALLEPRVLERMGVDLDGPAGIAFGVPDTMPRAAAMFVHLRDPPGVRGALYQALAPERRARLETVDDRVILSDYDFAIVLRGVWAFVVVGPDGDELAQAIARQHEATSLARQRSFRAAFRAAGEGSLRGYVDVRGLAYAATGMDARWAGTDLDAVHADIEARHRAALRRAEAMGAEPEALVRIDRAHRGVKDTLRDDVEAERLRSNLGAVDGLGLSLEMRDERTRLDASLLVPSETRLSELFAGGEPSGILSRTLPAGSGAMLEARVDPETIAEIARSWGLPKPALEPFGGAEVLAAALDGDVGLAVTLPDGGLAAVTEMDDLGFAARLGVTEPQPIRAALEALAALPDGPDLAREGERWRLQIGERRAVVRLTESALVVATETDLVDRIADPTAAPKRPASSPSPDERAASAAVSVPLALWSTRPRSAAWRAMTPTADDPLSAEPPSDAYREKRDAIEALDEEIRDALERAHEQARERAADRLAPLGRVSATLSRSEHALDLRIRWDREVGLVEAVSRVRDAEVDPWDDPEVEALLERRQKLLRELDALEREAERGD